LPSYGEYFKNIPNTVDYLIAGAVNDIVNKIINDNKIMQQILLHYLTNFNLDEQEVITQIINIALIEI